MRSKDELWFRSQKDFFFVTVAWASMEKIGRRLGSVKPEMLKVAFSKTKGMVGLKNAVFPEMSEAPAERR